jgi:NAD(P)-dependent dehydrogenase (short-subunit alcohol dehydrogenase family)
MGGETSKSSKYDWQTTSDAIGEEFGSHAAGKYVLITGGNCGLGLETTRVLAKYGAKVTITSRSLQAGEEAINKIKEESPEADLTLMQVDLGSMESVRDLARAYKATGKPLHILVNNAGVMACPKATTKDGLETQVGVNHIGHFLLTLELLDVLKSSGSTGSPARVVNLSSLAQFLFAPSEGIPLDDFFGDKYYHRWTQYGISKLCNVHFANELNRRMAEESQPVIAISLHPGGILETNLKRHLDFTGVTAILGLLLTNPTSGYYGLIEPNKNIKQGTSTTLLCCLDPDIVPGGYYSHCKIEDKLIHPKAKDVELGKKLWELSLKIIGGQQEEERSK